ncbi:MAG: phosphoserine phosphatase SerB, partial [Rhodospirillales bacterium]|nr:phosphoserine phosphatase SerB [Rhodospirillales bacterium]
YYGKPLLVEAARASIQHTDLTTALYYQGYADTDFTVDKK